MAFSPLFRFALGVLATSTYILSGPNGKAQPRESLAGEAAAKALKESLEAEQQQYNLRYGPVNLQTGAKLTFGYTDNVFYSDKNRRDDLLINPEVQLAALCQVSELNKLRLSLGIGYEYYVKNSGLNGDAPLINPESELVFLIFAGDFRIKLHEKFLYQESLFFNSIPGSHDLFFNFNDVGRFGRWDNLAGFNVDWDLDKLILSASFDHEDFVSTTARFDYLDRSSEWLTASGTFLIGDKAKTGVEAQASLHDYGKESVLSDNWRARVGPFVEVKPQEKISLRAGVGYDTAQYEATAEDSDFDTYYAYGSVSQETRLFTHSLTAGREHSLGDNANNLRTTYVRYSISSPVVNHVELGANASVNFAEEFGGAFKEDFTYYVAGFRAGYQFHKYWHADLGYEFLLKNSDLSLRDFYRDRVTCTVGFRF